MVTLNIQTKQVILEQSSLLNLQPDEYIEELLESYSEKNKFKQILLHDQEGFRIFLNQYATLIGQLFLESNHIKTLIEQNEVSVEMESVFEEIGYYIGHDSEFLIHLYTVYKKA